MNILVAPLDCAKGTSMNSDLGHDEAQFQWLRYQLDSRVKLLLTLVAKWLEHCKCVSTWLGDCQGKHV